MPKGLVLLDRDGVINQLAPRSPSGPAESPLSVSEMRLVSGVAGEIRRLHEAGWLVACVTNQPAAAKGECSLADLQAVHKAVIGALTAAGAGLDAVRICWHHPDGPPDNPLARVCVCRKPAPGMILDLLGALDVAPESSWMIGDTDADVRAGQAAGIRTILITNPASAHKRGSTSPTFTTAGLRAAVDIILAGTGAR